MRIVLTAKSEAGCNLADVEIHATDHANALDLVEFVKKHPIINWVRKNEVIAGTVGRNMTKIKFILNRQENENENEMLHHLVEDVQKENMALAHRYPAMNLTIDRG